MKKSYKKILENFVSSIISDGADNVTLSECADLIIEHNLFHSISERVEAIQSVYLRLRDRQSVLANDYKKFLAQYFALPNRSLESFLEA
jgi:phosphopantothenate synthetase